MRPRPQALLGADLAASLDAPRSGSTVTLTLTVATTVTAPPGAALNPAIALARADIIDPVPADALVTVPLTV